MRHVPYDRRNVRKPDKNEKSAKNRRYTGGVRSRMYIAALYTYHVGDDRFP